MTNLATLPADIRMTFEAQRTASLWISRVVAGKWTPEKVKLEIAAIPDEVMREEVRRWCRHYNSLRAIQAPPKPSPARKARYAHGRGHR